MIKAHDFFTTFKLSITKRSYRLRLPTFRRNIILLLPFFSFIILLALSASAQSSVFSSSGYASGSAEYLKLPVSAQSAGLCGAVSAWRDNVAGAQYNPAIYDVLYEGSYYFDGTYSLMTLDRKHLGFSAAGAIGGYLVAGLTFVSAGVDNIESRDSLGALNDTFNYAENAIAVSVAGRLIWNISLGATVRYLFEKMQTTGANGISADVGATWQPLDYLCVGTSAQNLGGRLWWSTGHSDPVLATIRAGICGAFIKKTLRAELDIVKPLEQPEEIALGLQYTLLDVILFRGGISIALDAPSMHSAYQDYALGFGIRYSSFGFDYGLMIPNSELGLTHRVTVCVELRNPFK
jgi:hypothetical protein